jgi:hypothetical protein
MTQLSPAAQAVLDAWSKDENGVYLEGDPKSLAYALRVVADQVVPVTPAPNDTFCCPPVATIVWMRLACVRAELLAIATELEAL